VSPFPALDPEPAPRPFWRAALIPGSVTLGIAVVVVLALTLPGALAAKPHKAHAASPKTWASQVPGEVIGWDTVAHTLLAMSPTGALRNPAVLATHVSDFARISPSGFGIMTNPGHVSYLENRALTPGPPAFPGSIGASDVFGLSPFAAHDNALVVGGRAPTGVPQVPVVFNINTSNRHKMPGAPADSVVGDPATMGAWVTVMQGAPPTGNYFDPTQPDARIEYRTPGKAPVVLVTAAQLRKDSGFKGTGGLSMTVYPAPTGKRIAVDVLENGTLMPAPEAIVVLTRTGQLVSKMPAPGLQQVTWSGAGNKLLLLRSEGVLTTWVPGHTPAPAIHLSPSLSMPDWGSCVFSPFDTYIVCAAFGETSVTNWALTRLSDRAVLTEQAHEIPVDWSP
jgi:hypothetical protein